MTARVIDGSKLSERFVREASEYVSGKHIKLAGYVDKFLQRTEGKKIGIAFDFQIVENIDTEQHDVFMDEIITEKKIIKKGS